LPKSAAEDGAAVTRAGKPMVRRRFEDAKRGFLSPRTKFAISRGGGDTPTPKNAEWASRSCVK